MKELTEIIKTMNASEVRLVRKMYKLDSDKENRKRLQLFNLVRDDDISDNHAACLEIYNHKPNSKFSHLKKRLKEDLLNTLLIQSGSSKFSAKYKQAEFDCRKLLLEGDMLISRGANIAGASILLEASKIAEKHHLTVEQIVIQDLLRSHLGYKKGLKVYKQYEKNIHYQLNLLQELFKAKEYLYYIGIENTFFKNKEHEFKQYAEQSILQLEKVYKETHSPNIGYYYFYIAIFYSEIEKDYIKGLDYALDFLMLVEKEPAIYTPSRHANANLQIAGMLMKLEQYWQATSYAEKAYNIFQKSTSINQLIALEVLFFSYLYSDEIDKASAILEKAFLNQATKSSKFNNAKWTYFNANLMFKKGRFEESISILRKNTELSKDKTGWSLGWQLLEIQNLIELDDTEVLYYRLESFKKLTQRNKNAGIGRTIKAVKIISALIKNNMNFKNALPKIKNDLEILALGEGDYFWDPLAAEITRFDKWFMSKIKK